MVQRYDLVSGYMQKWTEGEWVSYEDYAALEKLYRAAIEHMVAVHQRYNSDAGPALQKLYELSGEDERQLTKNAPPTARNRTNF